MSSLVRATQIIVSSKHRPRDSIDMRKPFNSLIVTPMLFEIF